MDTTWSGFMFYKIFSFILLHNVAAIEDPSTTSETSNDQSTREDAAYPYLLCRKCGHSLAKIDSAVNIPSQVAFISRRQEIMGVQNVLLQAFKNPRGQTFELLTAKHADVYTQTESVRPHSFWKGYKWQVCTCPVCGQHIGWKFSALSQKTQPIEYFYSLIFDRLLQEHEADSFLFIPHGIK